MHHTPLGSCELLEQAGYVWDDGAEGWHRRGEKPASLETRVLDGAIAGGLTREQIATWIKAGEPD